MFVRGCNSRLSYRPRLRSATFFRYVQQMRRRGSQTFRSSSAQSHTTAIFLARSVEPTARVPRLALTQRLPSSFTWRWNNWASKPLTPASTTRSRIVWDPNAATGGPPDSMSVFLHRILDFMQFVKANVPKTRNVRTQSVRDEVWEHLHSLDLLFIFPRFREGYES